MKITNRLSDNYNAQLLKLSVKGKKVPNYLKLLLLVGALGLSVYWWFSYSGLYRFLAEVQLSILGSFDVILTGLSVTVLMCLLFIICIVLLAQFVYGEEKVAKSPPKVESAAYVKKKTSFLSEIIPALAGSAYYRFGLILLVLTGGLAVLGTYFGLASKLTGSVKEVRLSEIDSSFNHKEVTFTDATEVIGRTDIVTKIDHSERTTTYLMIAADQQTINQSSPKIIVKLDETETTGFYIKPAQGILTQNTLDGLARTDFENQNLLEPGESFWVLDYGASQASLAHNAAESFQATGFFGLVSGILLLLYVKFDRKRVLQSLTVSQP